MKHKIPKSELQLSKAQKSRLRKKKAYKRRNGKKVKGDKSTTKNISDLENQDLYYSQCVKG